MHRHHVDGRARFRDVARRSGGELPVGWMWQALERVSNLQMVSGWCFGTAADSTGERTQTAQERARTPLLDVSSTSTLLLTAGCRLARRCPE
eukprot:3051564-Rhodomonas_salina.3